LARAEVTMRSLSRSGLLAALGALATSTALATPLPAVPVVDPNVVRALDTGLLGPYGRGTPGRTPVVIELAAPADAAALGALASAGATLAIVDGKPLAYDRFVPVDVDHASLAAVAKLPFVRRVASPGPRGRLPLDQSAKLIRLADARGARPALDSLTGDGVLIADIDSMIDPFAPAFFRGDGGYYDWIDVDGDGVFTPGVDAIDLDQNGVADPSEIAMPILARTIDYYGQDIPGARSPDFDPSTDFLYIDSNRNGQRDYGAAAGFDDTTPAFGEPLFVPDDVNRNGVLDVGERVVRLGTSKIRKIFVYLDYPPYSENHVYERGVDLSKTKIDYSGGALEGFPDAFHATGVGTILLGDVPLVGRRWVGLAPDADLEVAWDVDQTGAPTKGFTWALKDKPDVALFEMAVWTGVPLDGSDVLSAMIDTAVKNQSLTATCPTGDQGSALKHAHADLAAQGQASLPWNLPAKDKAGQGPLRYIDVSIDVRGGAPAAIALTGPGGENVDLTTATFGTLSSGDSYYATRQQTNRGTNYYDVILYVDPSTNEPPFPVGTWHVDVTGDASNALTVDAYVADDKSSWAVGAAWDPSVATDAATVGAPSVADHCIAVNAAPDHVGTPQEPWYDLYFYAEYNVPPNTNETQGQVRAYSPRGPRIDGVMKPDVTAPDNPWVADEHMPSLPYPYGSYSVFGGTSGASPHVTGTAALLAQAGIRGDAARDAIRAGAIVDSDTGAVPNGDYGWGRLDAAGALGVSTGGVDPSVTVSVTPAQPTTADAIELVPDAHSNDGNDAALEAKWDDGYDGTWDTPYGGVGPHPFAPPAAGRYPFKVRVRNASGRVAEAVVWVDVADAAAVGGGCGCRATPSGGGELGLAALSLALALLARRRAATKMKCRCARGSGSFSA
jgi:MYXO-CTERM domain-containing protein